MMKHSDSMWGPFRAANCPAGCEECSYDRDRFSARFSRYTLRSGRWLPTPPYQSHRILFVLSGSLHICKGEKHNHYLSANQCIFLARHSEATVMAHEPGEVIVLDFNNRLVLCNHDLLVTAAARNSASVARSCVLKITERLLVFFRDLAPALDPIKLHIPCYHIIKQHELFLLMWHYYGEEPLKCFFFDILKPKDDFELFVKSSYLKVKNISELARLAEVSERTFRRRFQEVFHEPYATWQVKQKAADIEQAVRDGVRDKETLIRMFAFKSQQAFYHFCQRHMGMTSQKLFESYESQEK